MIYPRVFLNIIIYFSLFYFLKNVGVIGIEEFCAIDKKCVQNKSFSRYILYDVNPPEGFNLRRDVYMRLAVLSNSLKFSKKLENFKLVLPPWSNLYHWKNSKDNLHIPWSTFFDLKSLQTFAPVIEMYQFFNEIGKNYERVIIDEVYILQNFEDMFETGKFEDKINIESCNKKYKLNYFEYNNLTSKNVKCLSFHGPTTQIKTILENSKSRIFLFHHAEIMLHSNYGDKIYWEARRSMRFNKELIKVANEFRKIFLNSTNDLDNIKIPDDWRLEKPHRSAKGGQYLSVHLRRQDFLRGRPSEVPDLENAAKQIKKILKNNKLTKIFIATDATLDEYNELKTKLSTDYEVFKYEPTKEEMIKYKDGGIAIIEQIICSYAYYFIGTHESTFTFRIQEEREILGFPVQRTFNRLCGNNKICEKPSIWKIVY